MPSNNDIFQSSFLNGLSMAQAQESGKLDAMQQAMQLQYGLQTKQLDFQLGMLKMREAQAAQAVELRMATQEHELKMREFALRAETAEMNKRVLETKMEEEKVATAAGTLFEQYQAGMRNEGFVPGSVEELRATDAALAAGGTFSDDPRINARIVAAHGARKEALQNEAFAQGTAALRAIDLSRSESRVTDTGTTTDKFYGDANLADLHLAAATFKRGADLGHEPSRQMYERIQKDIASVGQSARPGSTDAAGVGAGLLAQFSPTKDPDLSSMGISGTGAEQDIEKAIADISRSDAVAYLDPVRAKLVAAQKRYLLTKDARSAAVIADRLGKLETLRAAVNDPAEYVTETVQPSLFGAGGTTRTTGVPTLSELGNLENLAKTRGIRDVLAEIDAIVGRRQRTTQWQVQY